MFKKFLSLFVALGAFGAACAQDAVQYTAEHVTGSVDGTVNLTISMENNYDVRDVQCFVQIPEGIDPVLDEYGDPEVSWAGRNADHTITTAFVVKDGVRQIRIVAYSARARFISGNEGPLFTVPLKLVGEPGDYEVQLVEAYASKNDGTDEQSPDYTVTVTISDPTSLTLAEALRDSAEYYTIDGLRVNRAALTPGLYIQVTPARTTKVLVR